MIDSLWGNSTECVDGTKELISAECSLYANSLGSSLKIFAGHQYPKGCFVRKGKYNFNRNNGNTKGKNDCQKICEIIYVSSAQPSAQRSVKPSVINIKAYSGPGIGKCIGYDHWGDLYLKACTRGSEQSFKLDADGRLVVEGGPQANQYALADGWFWPKLRPCNSNDAK